MPPIHELHERLKQRIGRRFERADSARESAESVEVPRAPEPLEARERALGRHVPKLDETQPIPIYSE